jgi:phage virion morphogenesis protein
MAEELIEIEAGGFRDLARGIEALNKNLLTPSKRNQLVREVGAVLLARIRRRFLAQTDPDGKRWPVSKAAVIRKGGGKTYRYINGVRKGFGGTGTLFETGALFQSIQLGRAQKGEVNIGTDVPYARFVQEGTNRLPERIYLGFGDEDQRLATDFIEKRINDILTKVTKGG